MESIKRVNWDISSSISDVIDAQPGECVANITRAFLNYHDILPLGAVFTEGIYHYGGQYNLHTWIETADSIIDPSLVNEKKSNIEK